MNQIDTQAARHFFDAHFGYKPEQQFIQIWHLPEKETFCALTIDEAVARVEQLGGDRDIYCAVALAGERISTKARCKADEVSGIVGLWLDIDVKGPTHDQAGIPESLDDAQWLIDQLPLKPTSIIGSGTGLHVWYLFDEPWIFENDAERLQGQIFVARFANTMQFHAEKRGWNIRGTFDFARVLRPAGTFNQIKGKGDARPVVMLVHNADARYSRDHFEPYLDSADLHFNEAKAVEVGELKFDDSAQPPAEKFTALCESDELFRLAWECQRPDLKDPSVSGCDMSLAATAAYEGWTEQEVCDLIIAHRRKHGRDLKLGKPYYKNTIGKAFARVRLRAQQQAIATEELREAVGKAVASNDVKDAFKTAKPMASADTADAEAAIDVLRGQFGARLNVRELRKEARSHRREKAKRVVKTEKHRIEVVGEMMNYGSQALRYLSLTNNPPKRFARCGDMVHIATDERGRHTIKQPSEAWVRGELAREIVFYSVSEKKGEFCVLPPSETCRDILSRDVNVELRSINETPLPVLNGIIQVPSLRPDGTIISTPGYDAATGLYFIPPAGSTVTPVPDRPTAADIKVATELVQELLCDFPFESKADRDNAIGLLMTIVIRPIVPTAPMVGIDAPQMGSGKTLIARVAAAIATGREAEMASYADNDEEMRKLITSMLVNGSDLIILDNCDGVINSSSLARATTTNQWRDRILGSTREIALPQMATWILTGNNLTFGGDIVRRVFRIRIDAKSSRPWKDSREFRHPNLIQWTLENRGQIVAALLTLARAWFVAGQPNMKATKLGSFEEWSFLVGNILKFTGFTSFLANLDDLYEGGDDEAVQWELFLDAWREQLAEKEVTVTNVLESLTHTTESKLRDSLPDVFSPFLQRCTEQYGGTYYRIPEEGKLKIRMGKALKSRVGRRYGSKGIYLHRGFDANAKIALWSVRFSGETGNIGSVSSPNAYENKKPGTHTRDACDFNSKVANDGNTPHNSTSPRSSDFDPDDDDGFAAREREAMQAEGV